MLYNVGFATLSHAPALPKAKGERKSTRQEQERARDDRSDLTVGAEKSVASSTMFAILQMAEGAAEEAPPPAGADVAAAAFEPKGPDESQIWWINHPLMQRNYSLEFEIDDCYAEMKRIIDSHSDGAETGDFEPLKTAIEDHSIRFPVSNGSKELFNIIEIFFDERTQPAHSTLGA